MNRTPIQWTDFTVNPIEALAPSPTRTHAGHYCEKVGPDCANCYASRMQPRFGLPQFQHQRGPNMPQLRLNPAKLAQVLARRKPAKIFWCDMTDMFGWWVPFDWIAAIYGVAILTPWLTHQFLTKRPERALEFHRWVGALRGPDGAVHDANAAMYCTSRVGRYPELVGPATALWQKAPSTWPPTNVHFGVSAGSQAQADERFGFAVEVPAAVRFISAEPLIGAMDLRSWLEIDREPPRPDWIRSGWRPEFDWVIVGGESGPRARRCDVRWVETIVGQCRVAAVPVFVKQLGKNVIVPNDGRLAPSAFEDGEENGWPAQRPDGQEYAVDEDINGVREEYQGAPVRIHLQDSHGGRMEEWPRGLRVREWPRPPAPPEPDRRIVLS